MEDHIDPEFGYLIRYPSSWHIEAYAVGERIGTGSPGPEYMIAMTTVDGSFASDSSSPDDIARLFVSRSPKDPSVTLEDYEGPVIATLPGLRNVAIGGFPGIQWEERPVGDGWGGIYTELDLIDFVISIEGQLRGGSTFSACRNSVIEITMSFTQLD
jgi:hypothetical protein